MATSQPPTRIARQRVEIINDWGLHARPAAALAQLAKGFESSLTVWNGEQSAPIMSIAALLTLEAAKGTMLAIEGEGPDAEDAVQAVVELIESGFGEEHWVLRGQGTRCGVAIGTAHVLMDESGDIPHYTIGKASVASERKRLAAAVRSERLEYKRMATKGDTLVLREFGQLVQSMLDEEHMLKLPLARIESDLVNAEWALKVCVDEILAGFGIRDDPVWQSRADDYQKLMMGLVAKMSSSKLRRRPSARLGARKIVIAGSIGPSDVIKYKRSGYAGFVSSGGSENSHAAILARGLGMPAIVALDHSNLKEVQEGSLLVVDSDESELHIKPGKQSLDDMKRKAAVRGRTKRRKRVGKGWTISRDGTRIHLRSNVEFLDELDIALRAGAEGVGLFRTEFLLLGADGQQPGEEEQYSFYSEVVKKLDGQPVTFRTFDFGLDKDASQQGASVSPLGTRGIRYSLQEPAIFKEQLRALLRAADDGPLKIMFPMVCNAAEVRDALRLIDDAAEELGKAATWRRPEIGVMIEIPGTVHVMQEMAQQCDFFSIGSNDLIQYTLAVDRGVASLTSIADPCHPGVMFLLDRICRQAVALGKPLTLCGELASDPRMACLFCALGLREFSMNYSKIEEVRDAITRFNILRNQKLAQALMASQTAEEVREHLDQLI